MPLSGHLLCSVSNRIAMRERQPAITSLVLLLALCCSGCWTGDPEVYLIPDGYIGPVVVAFEQEDGQPARRDGDTLVYMIPPSGVLKTQAEFPENFRQVSYYYVNEEGRRSRLPDYTPVSEVPEDTVQVFNVISGYLGELVEPPGDTLVVYGGWATDTRSPSVRFLVGLRSEWEELAAQRDSVERSITRTVIIKSAPTDSSAAGRN